MKPCLSSERGRRAAPPLAGRIARSTPPRSLPSQRSVSRRCRRRRARMIDVNTTCDYRRGTAAMS